MLYRSFSTNLIIMTLLRLRSSMCIVVGSASRFSQVVSQYMHEKNEQFRTDSWCFSARTADERPTQGPTIRFLDYQPDDEGREFSALRSANQALAGSNPENSAIFVATSTSNKVAVLRTFPEMLRSASETRGCCSDSKSRRSLTLWSCSAS